MIDGALFGRFRLRVNHVWLLSRDTDEMLLMPSYEGAVVCNPSID